MAVARPTTRQESDFYPVEVCWIDLTRLPFPSGTHHAVCVCVCVRACVCLRVCVRVCVSV